MGKGIFDKSERAKQIISAVRAYSGYTAAETKRRILQEQNEEEKQLAHGNTRLPFGLCQRYGISLPRNATPRDAWDALEGKTGLSPQDFYVKLKGAKEGTSGQDGRMGDGQAEQASEAAGDEVETCTTHAELEEYLRKTYDVIVDASVHSLDFPAVKSAVSGMDMVLREFPQAKGVFRRLSTKNSGLMCARPNGEICFNPSFFRNGDATIQHEMEQSSRSGYHPKNNGTRECGAHEIGHILELALIQKRYPNGGDVWAWNTCQLAQEVVSKACSIIKQQTKQKFYDIKAEVSYYASEKKYTVSETLAECVADYIANGENAARLSREVWKILKKELVRCCRSQWERSPCCRS